MFSRANTTALWSSEARLIQLEVDVQGELPSQLQILGLADVAVKECRERVRAALKNCGFELPPKSIVINLIPPNPHKEGNLLDLAIALALLVAYRHLPQDVLQGRLISGELGLNGELRSVRGALAIADLAHRLGLREVLLPAANAGEAAALGVPVIPLRGLTDAVQHLLGVQPIPAVGPGALALAVPEALPDLSDVRGQEMARRAVEVAAAGGHNLLLIGPPGSGKTMLARRLPGLLPPLTLPESIEVTKIHSLVADEPLTGLIQSRPFRAPHSSTSTTGLSGGGAYARPGEASLAHNGVLFLDDVPEFRRTTLETLRQPLEEGMVTVFGARAARLHFPARFLLLASMNPCPCGYLGDPRHDCRCPPQLVERYRARVSGPLLGRIDLHVEVPAVTLKDLRCPAGESSEHVARRVAAARLLQLERFGAASPNPVNAHMDPESQRRHCVLDPAGQALLAAAFTKLGLSARSGDHILKVARTVADLAGGGPIKACHLAEAIQYRNLGGRVAH